MVGRPTADGSAPALPGCTSATSCTKVLFPEYAADDPAEIVTALDDSLRPACAPGFPAILLGPKGTPAETLDDLAGASRQKAASVGLGAFVPACK